MDVFDFLIHNEDRNQSNIAFTYADWQLWLIDHTRAFRTSVRRPKLQKDLDFNLTAEFRRKLEMLNQQNLSMLQPFLTDRQIDSILKRRDKLLNNKA